MNGTDSATADSINTAAPLTAADVAVACGYDSYGVAPFSPAEQYPEYPFPAATLSREPAPAYAAVRETLRLLNLDAENYGTPQWNPLGAIVKPGNTVVLKPNFVRDFRETLPGHDDCLTTHGAIIRAIADYVHIALGGSGKIVVADAPQNDADFEKVREIVQMAPIEAFYATHGAVPLSTRDLRPEVADKIDGVVIRHRKLAGDPEGYVKVDLREHSAFAELGPELCNLLYGSEYDTREIRERHRDGRHEYMLSRSVLTADVVISLPKFKTHKKTGLTVNMKNLVGINGNKNWLPHHREGTPAKGGDQFPGNNAKNRVEQSVVSSFKRFFPILGPLRPWIAGPIKRLGKCVFGDTNVDRIRSGNWHGNDTTWRMVIDLNRILFYADADGKIHDAPQRRIFSIVDGITAMEGNGPLDGTARDVGVVLAGINPVAVDLVCGRLMGFDYHHLPVLRESIEPHALPLVAFGYDDVRSHSNTDAYNKPLKKFTGACFNFKAHFGWTGHIESNGSCNGAAAARGSGSCG